MAEAGPHLADLALAAPSRESLAARYANIQALFERGGRAPALAAWDKARRDHADWAVLAQIRFQQDTADAAAKANRELCDELAPVAQGHDVAVKRLLLADPNRAGLEAQAGAHAVRLWEADITVFDPMIADRLAQEAALAARYTELTSSARLAVEGAVVNLSGLAPYTQHLDRAVRYHAQKAKWQWFAQHGAELDDVYGQLVKLRHGMARDLGYDDFIPLGYQRMRRTDYGPAEVAAYRDEIVAHVVPLMARLLEQRRVEHGWDRLHAWDLPLMDLAGNPKPVGTGEELTDAGQLMFDRMDARLSGLYRTMREGGFLDLDTRPSKAPGGFCDAFPSTGMPFIFANFTGTFSDISVLTHEMGHAAQMYESRTLPSFDYLQSTSESAEINSMALEMLCFPHAGLLVGDAAADRFRRVHLIQVLNLMLGCALGDHFQHEVYAYPDASPAERHAMWHKLAQRYTPWVDWGDLAYPAMGGEWQAVLHFYLVPFYYIDYALAQCCALQLWTRSQRDPQAALDEYMGLCERGGSAPFTELIRSAHLASPFAPGALAKSMQAVAAALGM